MGESICWKPPHRFLIIFHVVCHLGLWHKKQNSVWGKLFFFPHSPSLTILFNVQRNRGVKRFRNRARNKLCLGVEPECVQLTPSIFRLHGGCEVFTLGWKIEYKQVFLILKISWFSSMVLFEPQFFKHVVHWHIWIKLIYCNYKEICYWPYCRW